MSNYGPFIGVLIAGALLLALAAIIPVNDQATIMRDPYLPQGVLPSQYSLLYQIRDYLHSIDKKLDVLIKR